jgi:AmmeMemoRadiSam system protein B
MHDFKIIFDSSFRAIITPHAGYAYCGEVAAYAFKQVVPDKIRRVFVLGPSHVVFLSGMCSLCPI